MRFLFAAILLFITTLASSQEMFVQPVRLSNGDSSAINVSEVYVAYEQTDGSSKLAYGYPNSTILLRTDFDDLVANSCGNLVKVSLLQPGGVQEVGLNPQYVYRVYRISGKTKIQIRNTNQVFESPQSFAEVSALLGNCGAASAVSIDSVTVANDTICFYFNDATFDCFALTDTLTATNWYTSNGSTTDSLRFARIIKTAIWLGLDTTGLIRHQVGSLDGSRSTVYQDSVVLMKFGADATNYISVKRDETNIVQSGDGLGSVNVKSDIVNWSSTFAASVHQHNYLAASTYLRFDSSQKLLMGYFPNFPASTWGRGYYYDPSTANGVRLLNKDGGNTTTAKLELDAQNLSLGSTHTTSSSELTTFTVSQSAVALLTSSQTSSIFGALRFFQSTDVNEEVVGFQQAGATTKPTISVYLGQGYSSSQYGKFGSRSFNIESQLTSGPYPWIRIDLPDTATDSTGNNILAYNKWRLSNSTPSATNGVMSFHRWTGNATTADPGFITMPALADSVSQYELYFKWESSSTAATTDPGSGYVAMDALSPFSVANIVIDNLTDNGTDYTAFFDQIRIGDAILIYDKDNFDNWLRYDISGSSVDQSGTHFSIPVTSASVQGGEPSDNERVVVKFFLNYGEPAEPAWNVYNTDSLLKAGGTTVGLDSGSLKFNLKTRGTAYGIEMLGDDATGSNRFLSMRTDAGDSCRIQESSSDFLLISSGDFQNNIGDQYRTVADSAQYIEGTVQTVDSTRYILGMTSTGWIKRWDADTAGTVLTSVGGLWKQRALSSLLVGTGLGGIYGGSGTVPDGTTATLADDFIFAGPDISSFTLTTGTTVGGQFLSNFTGTSLSFRDTSGISSLEFNGDGATMSFTGGSTDRLLISGRDARYSADYSATYSSRSLIDKGFADGAYLSDADWTTGFSSATQATSSWTATNSASNVNAAIIPKGTGGVLADVPDGASTGGGSRGVNSADFQTDRNANTQVASGSYSTIPGGRRCTASGTYSFASGFGAVASGAGSVCFGGSGSFSAGASATGSNSFAMGTGADATAANAFAFRGDASAQDAVAFNATADKYGEFAGFAGWSFMKLYKSFHVGTAAQELFLDGTSLTATIPSGETWIVEVACLAECKIVGNGTGGIAVDDTYAATFRCVIANKGGTTALIGTVQNDMAAQSDATMSDVVFTITADNASDYLKVTYTGGANTGSSTQTNAYATLRVFKY